MATVLQEETAGANETWHESGMLAEDFLDFGRAMGVIDDERSFWSFKMGNRETSEGKCLPYDVDSPDTLYEVQCISFKLWKSDLVKRSVALMIAFVIDRGWRYTASTILDTKVSQAAITAITAAVKLAVKRVTLGSKKGIKHVQEEAYRRLLREGEFFLWHEVVEEQKGIDCRFIEVFDVCQPTSQREIAEDAEIPDEVKKAMTNDFIPGELGIVTRDDDAADFVGIWHRRRKRNVPAQPANRPNVPVTRIRPTSGKDNSEYEWYFLSADEVIHEKIGVDQNDPRGVSPWYHLAGLIKQYHLVLCAMNELAIKQSKFAVVRKSAGLARVDRILANARANARDASYQEAEGRSPEIVDIKGQDIEMHGMKTQAKNYVEVLQQDERVVGNVKHIPEFMITNDANTGNRSSLQSAESPFGREVRRDQDLVWESTSPLLFKATELSISDVNARYQNVMESNKDFIDLEPNYPLPETKDWPKEVKMLLELATPGQGRPAVISVEEICRRLGVSCPTMIREIESEAERIDSTQVTATPPNSQAG